MGNRAPQRTPINSGKTAPATSSAENALVMAQRQNEMKQRRKALTSSQNKGMRMNISTNSLPDLGGYFDDATSNGSAGDIGVPFDTEQLKDMLMSMGVQFSADGSASGSQIRDVISNDSVIKVFATMQEPDWTLPWQTLDVSDARGSGVVIEGGLILTAAHVIAQWTFLEIQKSTDAKKVPTKVVHVCHEADLALLAPMNPETLKDVKPVRIGAMPKRHDRVFVSGFPIGGEELSVTEGVVSRIEIQPYSHSLRQLLAVTVDAAINSGNSGGPVFDSKGELAGIAFQALEGAENVGHIIPPPIINHFLTGVARDGANYKGFPELGIAFQNMENPALRKHLKMKDEQTGVLVVKVWYGCSGYDVLMENDVVLTIDGYDVSNTGTIEFDDGVRGELALCIHKHFCGDRIPVKILRDGQVVEVNIELLPLKELTPLSQYIHKPAFFLSAGLLFQPLSTDLLRNYFSGGMMVQAPQELLFLATSPATKTRHEVVVLTRVFRDDINIGYEDLAFSVITHVNGQEVADLKHFVELFEGVKGDQQIKLVCSGGGTLILPSTEDELMKESVHRIMKRYNITGDRHLPAGDSQGKKKKHRKSLETANVAK